jgi:hypothetical protein
VTSFFIKVDQVYDLTVGFWTFAELSIFFIPPLLLKLRAFCKGIDASYLEQEISRRFLERLKM